MLTLNPSCNTATLATFNPTTQNPWTTSRIKHAYRRMAFGASQDEVDAALAISPSNFIDGLIDTAKNLPPTPAPFWGNYSYDDFTHYAPENRQYVEDWTYQTANDLISEKMRGRMTFFWMNHFVTESEVYKFAPYMYQYYHLMQVHCLGNLKTFVREVGLNNAMLVYLNGYENTKNEPNENYARELLELFTLGEANGYSEDDITNAARALTGYNHRDDFGAPIYFDASTFDDGEKTIFGKTGNWGYDDFINLIFSERANELATFICTKLYKFFVSPSVDTFIEQSIIPRLVKILINNNFEMVPMLKKLLQSKHFFDRNAIGIVIRSPYDVIFNYINETSFFYDDDTIESINNFCEVVGQKLYNPPDVSGWQRDEMWISPSTLTGRWELIEFYNLFLFDNYDISLTNLAKDLTNNSNDPAFISKTLIDHFVSNELFTITDYDIATDIFKWEVPQNYYDDGIWNLDNSSAPYQVLLLLNYIAHMPEFQLK